MLAHLKSFLTNTPLTTGQQAEKIARHHLETQGLIFIEQNYRCKQGEIDLVMQEENTLVFIEVRYRANAHYGSSAESVNYHKQRKLIISAEHYLHTHPTYQRAACRFDVVALCPDKKNTAPLHIEWIKNAFETH